MAALADLEVRLRNAEADPATGFANFLLTWYSSAVFDTGPQFVFNFGGGPGIRVHQFGGARPRGRPRDTQNGREEQQGSGIQNLIGMLPILLFFIFPLLTSLFGGDSASATPKMAFEKPQGAYTHARAMPVHSSVKYYVRPKDVEGYRSKQWDELDRIAEKSFVNEIYYGCQREQEKQARMREEAQGWFFQDEELMAKANALPLEHCNRWMALMKEKKDKGK